MIRVTAEQLVERLEAAPHAERRIEQAMALMICYRTVDANYYRQVRETLVRELEALLAEENA